MPFMDERREDLTCTACRCGELRWIVWWLVGNRDALRPNSSPC